MAFFALKYLCELSNVLDVPFDISVWQISSTLTRKVEERLRKENFLSLNFVSITCPTRALVKLLSKI